MAVAFDEVKSAAVKSLRASATRYGDSALEYGKVLRDFGEGQAGAEKVVKTGLELALRQARTTVEEGIRFSTTYWQWAYSLVGMYVPPAQEEGAPEVVPPAPAKVP